MNSCWDILWNVNYKKKHHWIGSHCSWFIRKFLDGKEQKYQLCSPFAIFLGNHRKGSVVLDFSTYWYTLTHLAYLARWRHHQRRSYFLCLRLCLYWLMQKHFPSPEAPQPQLDPCWGRAWASTSPSLVPPKGWQTCVPGKSLCVLWADTDLSGQRSEECVCKKSKP